MCSSEQDISLVLRAGEVASLVCSSEQDISLVLRAREVASLACVFF